MQLLAQPNVFTSKGVMNKSLGTPGSNSRTPGQGEQVLDEECTPHTHFSPSRNETLHNDISKSIAAEKRPRILEGSSRRSDVGSVIAHHETLDQANSLASIDRPPSEAEELPPAKIYRPLSIHVLALLMPASIFGVLARLGLQALTTYDGQSIFPLAYVQATGCFIMGIGLGMKTPFGNLYASLLHTAFFLFIPICSTVMVRCTRL
jgi:CrcB protein